MSGIQEKESKPKEETEGTGNAPASDLEPESARSWIVINTPVKAQKKNMEGNLPKQSNMLKIRNKLISFTKNKDGFATNMEKNPLAGSQVIHEMNQE